MVFGLAVTLYFAGGPQNGFPTVDFSNPLNGLLSRLHAPEPEAAQVLIVTANPHNRLTAVATLSPRGFSPLLASKKSEVLSEIRAHPATLKLAVVDAALPDFALIQRALNNVLPVSRIIVVKASTRLEDVGPMLLDRLGILQSKRLQPPRPLG
jgi:CheY-like chemotaxis protein